MTHAVRSGAIRPWVKRAALIWALLAAAPARAEPVTIVALGDSLTAGYGLKAADSFPSQLEAALRADGRDVRVINAGVSGDTTAGGLRRVGWVLQDKPRLVIVALGANDMLRGLPPDKAEENLAAILDRIEDSGAHALLAGMKAIPNMGMAYGDRFAGIFEKLAVDRGLPLYPFFLEGVAADPTLNLGDGVHPNARGVAIMVQGILPLVEEALDDID